MREGTVPVRRRRRDETRSVGSGIDWDAWLAENLPDEHYGFALMAVQMEWLQRPMRDRRMPTRDEVRARLVKQGRSMERKGGVA